VTRFGIVRMPLVGGGGDGPMCFAVYFSLLWLMSSTPRR
jgi:hypothetical protein